VESTAKIDFFKEFNRIKCKSIPTRRRDNTGIGATLEYHLGIIENNVPIGDFIDTNKYNEKHFELKAKREHSSSRISLKTKSPTGGMNNQQLLDKYGYKDTNGKNRLNLKVNMKIGAFGKGKQTKFWKLERNGNILYIIHKTDGKVSSYNIDKVGLFEKAQNLVLVTAESKYQLCNCENDKLHKDGKHESFNFKKAEFFFNLKKESIIELLDNGKLVFEFRLHKQLDGEGENDEDPKHDRGNVFRISKNKLGDLYETKLEFV
jgi:hypothetical protein